MEVSPVLEKRDEAGHQRDQAGEQRDEAGDQRDQAGEQRDEAGDQRDQAGDQRDQAGDQRDQAGDQRDQAADRRDQVADDRDHAAAQRDRAAAQRDQAADLRDQAAAQRDQAAARAEALLNAGITTDALQHSAQARREAASDRRQASEDRRAGASERTYAESDRDTALADRGAGASERTYAESDRDTALADRGAGASERTYAESDRDTALADRGAGAIERTYAESDRDIALADRWASASDRGERQLAAEVLAAARDAAMESSRLKSEFMATMSHEIRTPMNGIVGLTSLLLETDLDDEQLGYAKGVQGSGRALLAIVDDILDLAKIEAGRLDLESTDLDIVQVVKEAAELVAEAAKRKGLKLEVSCDPTLPARLRGDPGRLRQVVLNLAANAVKFTLRGGVFIRVRAVSEDEGSVVVCVEVTDTGIGIAEADYHLLYEPFRQADASTTRRFGGTGLGLAIASRLVGAMGGEIGFDSELGQGSVFWCTVALRRGTETEPVLSGRRAVAEPAALAATTRGRVLVVEDDSINQFVVVTMLRKLGYQVDVAANGLEALDSVERAVYAAIIMDCQMPEMDGYEATAAIRRRPGADRGTPIIALTAGAMRGDEERCLAAGMDDYIAKPVTIEAVDKVLARWIGARSDPTRFDS